ncbi:MAG: hypothetical protein V4805_07580 [Pseudomonadota bacterium]
MKAAISIEVAVVEVVCIDQSFPVEARILLQLLIRQRRFLLAPLIQFFVSNVGAGQADANTVVIKIKN